MQNENVRLSELFETFIKQRQYAEGNSKATIKNLRKNFDLLQEFNPDIRLKDLTEKTIVEFLEFLNTRKRQIGKDSNAVRIYKNSSIATVRGKLNAFFNWLKKREYIEKNPFEDIEHPEVSYTDRRSFTGQEFDKICNAISFKILWENLYTKTRNLAIIMFLVWTGARKGELLGLKLPDVNLENKTITIRGETSKSKRTRILPLHDELKPFLEAYLKIRAGKTSEAFWVSSTQDTAFTEHGLKHLINKLSSVTKINCHVHRFRHTFATNFFLKTHDILTLNKLLGHSTLRMTLRYLRSLPNDDMTNQLQKLTMDDFV